jgi:hypothetical protein
MNRALRFAAALLLLAGLGACVVAPAGPPAPYYGYGYGYGYGPGYYAAPAYVYPPVSVGLGFGGCFNCGWRHWR